MKVSVTQKDIDKGTVGDCILCPIARALSRAKHRKMRVGMFVYYEAYSCVDKPLPPEARNFVKRFDKGLKVKPFEFEV